MIYHSVPSVFNNDSNIKAIISWLNFISMIWLIENIEYEHECPGKYFRSENLQGSEAFMYMVVSYQTLCVIFK